MAETKHDPEQDLTGATAAQRLREIVTEAHTCMMVTRHEFPLEARPMSAQGVDDDGTVWFLSAADSGKNREVEQDSRMTLIVQNARKYEYARISGHATIHRDRALIEKHWSPVANAWFDGKDDPRVSLLAFHPATGEYWVTRDGKIVTAIRLLLNAAGANVDEGGKHGALRL